MPEHQQLQQSKKPGTSFQKQATPVSQTPVSNPYSIIQRAKINPKSLSHADIMQLQRSIGNQAVGRLLSSIGNTSTTQQATVQRQEIPEEEEPLQGKMTETVQRQEIPEEEEPLQGKMIETVQRQEIPEEEEPLQGKMAETVQRQEIPEEEEPLQGKMIETIQRQEIPEEEEPLQGKFENKPETTCPSCFEAPIVQRQELEEEEPLQGKFIEVIQRQEIPEEEEPLQGKMIETVQRQEIPEEEEPLQTKRENNTGMPDNLKAGVESLSGIDLSDVRVNYNSSKPAEVGALAYTQGTDIHVASGQERHLPHEAWHVVQQAQGRVRPTLQMKDIRVNDDVDLEKEADAMGEMAVKTNGGMDGPQVFLSNYKVETGNSEVVQCAGAGDGAALQKALITNVLPAAVSYISSIILPLVVNYFGIVNPYSAMISGATGLVLGNTITKTGLDMSFGGRERTRNEENKRRRDESERRRNERNRNDLDAGIEFTKIVAKRAGMSKEEINIAIIKGRGHAMKLRRLRELRRSRRPALAPPGGAPALAAQPHEEVDIINVQPAPAPAPALAALAPAPAPALAALAPAPAPALAALAPASAPALSPATLEEGVQRSHSPRKHKATRRTT